MMFLGIDAGTEAIKAGLFDAEGNLLAQGTRAYKTYFPKPGYAEQDPDEWWQGLVGAVHNCMAAADVPADAIQGICADATTCTMLPIRADGTPLRRALLWMDVRASEQAQRIYATGHDALRYSLAGVSAEWMPSKVLWLKEREPDTYNNTDYFIEYTDWIAYKLTGRLTLNINTVTQRWFYHTPSGGWDSDFFNTIGLDDVQEKFPADVLPLGKIVGGLSAQAAEALGLPAGIPVAAGGGDAFVGILGLGVVKPGDLGVVMGSSNVLSGLSAEEFHSAGIFGSYPDAVIPGLNLVEGGQVSTGSILNWFKRTFAAGIEQEANAKGVSVYKLLDDEADAVPIGSDGLIVLDYFQGNRTPHTDSLARGNILGMTLQTTRGHVFRALMEGIAYGMRDILETFAQNNYHVERIIGCGGATKSPTFMQIYADVLGKPLYTTQVAEASLLGSAILAAVGAGAFPDAVTASEQMVKTRGEYHPNMENHAAYQFYFEKYQQTYPQLRGIMHDITRKVNQ